MKEFDQIFTDIIKPKLKDNGFKVSGNTFHRQESEFLIVFDIWKSSWNNASEISFWFETGVYRDTYYNFMFNESPPKLIRTNHCSICLQTGSMLNKGVPSYQYHLTTDTKDSVRHEIENDLNNTFLPFLNKLKKVEDILVFEDIDNIHCNNVKLFVGFALAEKGDSKKAKILIKEYLNNGKYPQNWIDRIEAECKRLNL